LLPLFLGELDHVINPQDSDDCLSGELRFDHKTRINLKNLKKW
jgi:hypothetical protein